MSTETLLSSLNHDITSLHCSIKLFSNYGYELTLEEFNKHFATRRKLILKNIDDHLDVFCRFDGIFHQLKNLRKLAKISLTPSHLKKYLDV